MMNQNSKISIIIPTYNRSIYYLSRAVRSVIKQTYKITEIIVVDDNLNNSDYSFEIRKYCENQQIIYLKTKGKQGANVARNLGAQCSTGAYLAFLDDDDVWLPNKLEIQLNFFSGDIGMVYSNGYVITPTRMYLYTNPQHFVVNGNLYKLLIHNYIGPTITGLIKRQCFFSVGMFDEKMPSKQDYDLWIRINIKYKSIGVNIPLYLYYQNSINQMTHNLDLILNGYKKMYIKYISFYKQDYVLQFFFYLKIAILYHYQRKYKKRNKFLYLALLTLKKIKFNIIF